MSTKKNERAWAIDLISWIKEYISQGKSIFQDATGEDSLKVSSGKTRFPDVLLFIDKIAGIVFNGWELKFPNTSADDKEMLENALEKAEKLKANSFVTWNGAEAIIWKIENEDYTLESLKPLKRYNRESEISKRSDLEALENYRKHEPKLRARAIEILKDLESFYSKGVINEAINISDNIVIAIGEVSKGIIPEIKNQIIELKGEDQEFRAKFNEWKILESSTLKILSSSSRKVEKVDPELVLARFTYYKLIGKILFYLTLAENLSAKIPKCEFDKAENIKQQLESCFNEAKKIDYQAVFEVDFTDKVEFNKSIEILIFKLLKVFAEFDFRILPTEVIGYILENLVPKDERQKFGQYFTSEPLAYFVAFPAIKSRNSLVFDCTSGTGTFLNCFYSILKFYGAKPHQQILEQIWGNDISHFPAVLSVINLYKQDVHNVANFPRVSRRDFFTLEPKQKILFPDNVNIDKLNEVEIPQFDAIITNFPFIQQEDIPKETLIEKFKKDFKNEQAAFLDGKTFRINERSDYYVYCFYHSLKFLKDGGYLSAITSNAWLGKDYGIQFKKFLLNNFHIQYIVRSNAEHWFTDSKVSTVFVVLQKAQQNTKPTKFITINFKLDEHFKGLQEIEDFYAQIEHCERSDEWQQDAQFKNVYCRKDNSVRVSIVEKSYLENSLTTEENWSVNFIAQDPLSIFEKSLINPAGKVFTNGRGTRTDRDEMYILSAEKAKELGIEREFLLPMLKTSQLLKSISFKKAPDDVFFVCDKPMDELQKKYPKAHAWIKKWEKEKTKTGVLMPVANKKNKPYWYTLNTSDEANIFISINPNKRLFFSYSPKPLHLNQRLVAIRTKPEEAELIAALLNSIVSLLVVELNGVSRSLGALDLNADFFKTKMKMLNPELLKEAQKEEILKKFRAIENRPVEDFTTEFTRKDRIDFDKTVLKAFGYKENLLPQLYEILTETATNRVEMKDR
jgi:hypothetical protein